MVLLGYVHDLIPIGCPVLACGDSEFGAVEVLKKLESFPAEMKPSMLYDLEAGRRLELDWLNGTVARLGKELGVETPANAKVTEALQAYAMGGA